MNSPFIPAVWADQLSQTLRRSITDLLPPDVIAEAKKRAEEEHAEHAKLLLRHDELIASQPNKVVQALLAAHAPTPGDWGLECRACPPEYDRDGGSDPQTAPCPTWTLIDEVARDDR